jgi:Mg2+-importing ATPase
MNQYPTHLFWNKPATFWMNHFQTNDNGFSNEQIYFLRKKHKEKRIKENSILTELNTCLVQFKSPLMLLLIAAVILSAFLGDTSDVFIILLIVLSTVTLSYFQERNAQNIVKKLQSLLAHQCVVFRNGKAFEIPSEELLPGDIVLFSAGNLIPADCLIIECNELHVNESSLTGESFPVRKNSEQTAAESSLSQRSNCLWMGTNVISGTAKAIVIHTNEQTLFNQIVVRSHSHIPTSFEKGINDFGLFLMKITLVLALFIFCVNLYFHENLFDAGLFALALAVGMAPELLPAITTIAMSAGAKRLLAKKVIVKKLNAIQNLGEIDLLCTDKTGTLTAGNITIHEIVNAWGLPDKTVENYACWNACLEGGYSNPIDEALKNYHSESSILPIKLAELPYDFNRKRLSILVQQSARNLIVTKGAFAEIISICTHVKSKTEQVENISEHLEAIENIFKQFASKGFRVIALCYKENSSNNLTLSDEINMIFGGFVLLSDPVKEGIQITLQQLNELGIGLKIITGDNQLVAHALGRQLGIENPKVLSGDKLAAANPEAIPMLVNEYQIFAEIDPQQKEQIILALKHNHAVAYMGDGINDVAALHAADIGISVDNAVDIAKEAADFVLLEKNLDVLIEGIREGRKTFANTLKYIFINTGSTFGNMFSVAGASLLLPFLPMLPKQILLTNFITDFPYLSIASDNVDAEQLKRPGKWDIKTIQKYMVVFGIHSSIFDLLTFFVLWKGLRVTEHGFQTAWFIESILTELFILFIIRTHQKFFKSLPGKWLFIMSAIGLITTFILPYVPLAERLGFVPLPIWQMAILMGIVTCYILTADFLKVWFFKSSLNKLTEK